MKKIGNSESIQTIPKWIARAHYFAVLSDIEGLKLTAGAILLIGGCMNRRNMNDQQKEIQVLSAIAVSVSRRVIHQGVATATDIDTLNQLSAEAEFLK